MKNLIGILALSSLLICAPAIAQSQAPAAKARAKTDTKPVCTTATETGSLVKKRKICLTAKQRDEVALHAEQLAREMQTLVTTERGN